MDASTKIYEDAIATMRNDLVVINSQRKEFTPVAELKHVEISLNTLESRRSDFQQLLLRPDRRREILNLGRTVLKSLFGTATVADRHKLHSTLGELKSKEVEIVHSLRNQLTCQRSSSKYWDYKSVLHCYQGLVQSHDRYVQMTRYILWLSMTFFNRSSLCMLGNWSTPYYS